LRARFDAARRRPLLRVPAAGQRSVGADRRGDPAERGAERPRVPARDGGSAPGSGPARRAERAERRLHGLLALRPPARGLTEGADMRTMIADRGMGEPISLGAALASGKKTPPDVLNLLMDDHRVVLGWFAWYEQAGDPAVRLRVTEKICKALRAHMAGEGEIFYPEAARATGDDELVRRALQEH